MGEAPISIAQSTFQPTLLSEEMRAQMQQEALENVE